MLKGTHIAIFRNHGGLLFATHARLMVHFASSAFMSPHISQMSSRRKYSMYSFRSPKTLSNLPGNAASSSACSAGGLNMR